LYKGQHRTVCGCAADDKADDMHKDDADARRQAQGRAVYKDEQYTRTSSIIYISLKSCARELEVSNKLLEGTSSTHGHDGCHYPIWRLLYLSITAACS